MRYNEPRRRRYRRNAPRRRYRRNQPGVALRLQDPMTWAPYLVTSGLAATVTVAAPRFLGLAVTPMQAYMVQGAVAVGGGLLIPMMGVRPIHGLIWFATSGAIILADSIGRFFMRWMGLAAYPYETVGQLPYYPPQLYGGAEAYPYETVEQYEAVPSAPYEPTY